MSNKLKRNLDKDKMIGYIDQFLSTSGMENDQLVGLCLIRKFKPSLKNRYRMALELSIAALTEMEENNKAE